MHATDDKDARDRSMEYIRMGDAYLGHLKRISTSKQKDQYISQIVC